jgi:CheY-like chemotaxis protein
VGPDTTSFSPYLLTTFPLPGIGMLFTPHEPNTDSEFAVHGVPPLVMVVDDHRDTREMLRYAIESYGCRVVEASDGGEAVLVAQTLSPKLIIMDASLPQVDGLMATQRIRELESGPAIPIIFLSGRGEPQARELALSAGGDEYLVKPVNLAELRLALTKYLPISRPKDNSQRVLTRASGSS